MCTLPCRDRLLAICLAPLSRFQPILTCKDECLIQDESSAPPEAMFPKQLVRLKDPGEQVLCLPCRTSLPASGSAELPEPIPTHVSDAAWLVLCNKCLPSGHCGP